MTNITNDKFFICLTIILQQAIAWMVQFCPVPSRFQRNNDARKINSKH